MVFTWKIAVFSLMASLMILLVVPGCGESRHSEEEADETTVSAAAAPVETDVMTAEDMPSGIGSRFVFDSNTPGKTVDVSFDLEGPWNFSNISSSSTLGMTIIATEAAFSSDEFPDADYAVMSSWSPGAERIEYNFQDIDEDTWSAYGKSAEKSRVTSYSTPSRALTFPVAVGNNWVDSYNEIENGKIVEITAENRILSHNTLTVPAGAFNAFLLQTKVSATYGGVTNVTWDYTWFVPEIGRAAEIISQPNEAGETFSKARVFYRLKSFSAR